MGDYERGLKDAWEAARSFVNDLYNPDVEQIEILEKYRLTVHWAFDSLHELFFDKGPEYAIERLRIWKEKQEIHVGDEVKNGFAFGVVTDVNGNTLYGIRSGAISFQWNKEYVTKTGRHFPEVAELLEKMKEGNKDA